MYLTVVESEEAATLATLALAAAVVVRAGSNKRNARYACFRPMGDGWVGLGWAKLGWAEPCLTTVVGVACAVRIPLPPRRTQHTPRTP